MEPDCTRADGSSQARRLNAERVMLLAWSRAILMQLAHPLVAAGVAEHSTFRGGPLAAAGRLHHTVRAMLALTFGTPPAREQALGGIRAIHRRVNGRLSQDVGRFPAGTPYSAEDPALLLWVHATLLDSIPLAYGRLVAPLSDAERDAYCAEAAPTAEALGARPADVPRRWVELQEYLDAVYSSGRLAVGQDAMTLAGAVLRPPMARVIAPVTSLNRLFTVGLLPDHIRRQYGFGWSAAEERRLDRASRIVRSVRRRTPAVLALWPEARRG